MYEEALFKMTKHHYLVNHKLFINLTALFVMQHVLETQNAHYGKERKNMFIISVIKPNKVLFISICSHMNITAI